MLRVIKEISSKAACASCSDRIECETERREASKRLDPRAVEHNPPAPKCASLAAFQLAANSYEEYRTFGSITATGMIEEEGSYALTP